MLGAAKDSEVLTPPRKKVRDEVEERSKGIRKAPPTECPPMVGVEWVGEVQGPAKVPPQRKQPAPLSRCRSMGCGIWLGLVEHYTTLTDVEQKR